jgi:DNA-directed RNA polymerase specialized sigma24 family protein
MPNSSPDINSLDASNLADRCQQRDEQNTHERFCYELFRRAILQAKDYQACWSFIVEIYRHHVTGWLRRTIHGLSIKEQEDMASDAFARFFKSYNSKELESAQHRMASVMRFLRVCAMSEAIDELRRRKRRPEQPMSNEDMDLLHMGVSAPQDVIPGMILTEHPELETEYALWQRQVWQRITQLIRNERERIVAESSLSDQLKPRDIHNLHPGIFKSAAYVSEVKRMLFNRLAQDKVMQALYENRPTER